ncbi:MAG: hypothetical protein P1V35_18090, partial [Planctomycetota bacterium]|nr:hypothetical protein [Planctomycetota bacterium]
AVGSDFAVNNAVTLNAFHLPVGQFGYFLNSDAPGSFTGIPNSMGTFCLGGGLGRYNQASEIFLTSASGEGSLDLDLNNTPTNTGSTSILAGQTWYFQGWHRDTAAGTSYFTNGVEISFQ